MVPFELSIHKRVKGLNCLRSVLLVTLKQRIQVSVNLNLVHLFIMVKLSLMKDILAVNWLFKPLVDYWTDDIRELLPIFIMNDFMQWIQIFELHIKHLCLNLLHLVLEFFVFELFLRGLTDDRDQTEYEFLLLSHGRLRNESLSLCVLDSLSEYRDFVLDKGILTLDLLDLVVLVLNDLAQVHRLVLKPLQRLLQSVYSVVHLHLELLFSDRFLDKQQLLLNTQHMTLYPLVKMLIPYMQI